MRMGFRPPRFIWLLLLIGLQLLVLLDGFTQSEETQSAPPGGSLLILLMGLGAIFLVGLTFVVRERMNETKQRDQSSG